MSARYTIRALAQTDLEYTCKEWGASQADRYLQLLISRFDWLTDTHLWASSVMILNPVIFAFLREGI